MKKLLLLLNVFLILLVLAGCVKEIDYETHTVHIYFVTSRNAEDTLEAFSEVKTAFVDLIHDEGYPILDVAFHVTSSIDEAKTALLEGNADIVWMSASQYVKLSSEESKVDVILSGSLNGINKSSTTPSEWNDGLPTTEVSTQVAFGQSLILAGVSTKGILLSNKISQGTSLTWDDVNTLSWCLKSTSSVDGYQYPNLWLSDNFNHRFEDLFLAGANITFVSFYGDAFMKLANGTCDVAAIYADARISYADEWTLDYGRTSSIWEETNVIGVTKNRMNDVYVVTTEYFRQGYLDALQNVILTLSESEEGQFFHTWFGYDGLVTIQDSDFEDVRDLESFLAR